MLTINVIPLYAVIGEASGFVYLISQSAGDCLPFLRNGRHWTGESCCLLLWDDQSQQEERAFRRTEELEQIRNQPINGHCPFEYVAPIENN